MERIKKILEDGFYSSSVKTPQFKSFARLFKNDFTKELNTVGATLKAFTIGHFYLSGFFSIGEQLFYFSISDVRMYKEHGQWGSVLIRIAKDLKDYNGGTNTYTDGIKTGMMKEWVRLSQRFGYLPKEAIVKQPGQIGAF